MADRSGKTDHTEKIRTWNRNIRRFYWSFAAITAFVIVGLIPYYRMKEPENSSDYLLRHVLMENGLNLLVLGAAELALRFTRRYQDYIVVSIGAGIPAVILYLSDNAPGIEVVLITPILVSVLYFKRRMVVFSGILTLGLYAVLVSLPSSCQYPIPPEQKLIGIGVIAATVCAAFAIVKWGLAIAAEEEESLQRERRHRIQQTLIDERLRRDALTGLFNHRAFQERLRAVLEEEPCQTGGLYLALIDIDFFKKVNDRFGHRAGDEVLRQAGRLIRYRGGEEGMAARYGGEEFALLLRGIGPEEASSKLDALRAEIASVPFQELDGQAVTVSIGCCRFESGMDGGRLFQLADEALYEAKRAGRNRVVWR